MEKTLLAIDDEKSILMIIEFVFGKKYRVVQKSNGKEALAWLQEGNMPHVIIADLNMPEMNGFEFILQIRASGLFREIPLIMLSGNENSADKIKCLRGGADDYMLKPFNPEELEARIDSILRRVNQD